MPEQQNLISDWDALMVRRAGTGATGRTKIHQNILLSQQITPNGSDLFRKRRETDLSLGPHGVPDVEYFMHFNQLLSSEM